MQLAVTLPLILQLKWLLWWFRFIWQPKIFSDSLNRTHKHKLHHSSKVQFIAEYRFQETIVNITGKIVVSLKRIHVLRIECNDM